MSQKSEIIVGIVAFVAVITAIYIIAGPWFLVYLLVLFVLATIAIYLFSRKSIIAKAGSILVFKEVALKLMMPRKYKKAIQEMDKLETNGKT